MMPSSSKSKTGHHKQTTSNPTPKKHEVTGRPASPGGSGLQSGSGSASPDQLREIKLALKQLEDLPSEIIGLRESVDLMNQHFENMRKDILIIKNENKELKATNDILEKKVVFLEDQINDLDAYGRRQNLEIHNVPIKPNEDSEATALLVLQKVKDDLKASDIEIAHRIGKETDKNGQKKTTRPIIVRFYSRKIRNAIYQNRKRIYSFTTKDMGFKEDNFTYINENLTNLTKQLMSLTNRKRKEFNWRFIWTVNGKIFVKKSEEHVPIYIRNMSDLDKIQ